MEKKRAKNENKSKKPELTQAVNDIYLKVNEIKDKAERSLAEISKLCSDKGPQEN